MERHRLLDDEPGTPRTPFLTALLARRGRLAADPEDVSPWPAWAPQPDMIPLLDAR